MKKLLLLVFVSVLFVGCSKKDNEGPDALFGTWKATSVKTVYQNSNGTPYRDKWIKEDDFENDPDLRLIISKKTVISIGEDETGEELPYVSGKDYIEVAFEGEKIRLNYTISGNTLILKNTETNVNIYDDVIVGKVMMTITMLKQ